MHKFTIVLGALAVASAAAASDSDSAPAKPVFREDGTVSVPAFELPPSELSSPEARAGQAARARHAGGMPSIPAPIAEQRKYHARAMQPRVDSMRALYPVNVTEEIIAGIPTRMVTPKDGKFDPRRVLINVHGGAFTTCWESCSLLESVPVAALGRYKVISVNYRMAPEHRHPAGAQDAAAVYRELLKRYKAQSIGIFGCSAGGSLTAQLAAWLPAHGLPQAGAIGIFGAGGVRFMGGDSAWVAAYIDGSFPAPPLPGQPAIDMTRGYFDGWDMKDASISPALHPEVAAKFPPTLIITGTRAMDMSPAIVTNSTLLKAGVKSTLIVGEAMGHCYIYQSDLPEARDAHLQIVNFFRANLK